MHGLKNRVHWLDNKAIAAEYSVEIQVNFGQCFAYLAVILST